MEYLLLPLGILIGVVGYEVVRLFRAERAKQRLYDMVDKLDPDWSEQVQDFVIETDAEHVRDEKTRWGLVHHFIVPGESHERVFYPKGHPMYWVFTTCHEMGVDLDDFSPTEKQRLMSAALDAESGGDEAQSGAIRDMILSLDVAAGRD